MSLSIYLLSCIINKNSIMSPILKSVIICYPNLI